MRIGLIAAARITHKALVDPASKVDDIDVVVVGARDLDRARASADEWGVADAVGSYEEVLARDDVDAVYIATPATAHHKWTLAALAAGKHVLCEKPLAANAVDAAEMIAAGDQAFADRGLILMEAYHWRYHPLVGQMKAILTSGELGTVQHISGHFNLPDGAIPRGDIRWNLAIGGGATMDLGCYPIQWARFAAHTVGAGEPTITSASAVSPIEQIDGKLTAELAWDAPQGAITGTIESSMIEDPNGLLIDLVVTGTNGTMRVNNPLAPQNGDSKLEVEIDGTTTEHEVSQSPTYFHQLVAFKAAVDSGTMPITSGADALATMQLVDNCYKAAGLQPRPSA